MMFATTTAAAASSTTPMITGWSWLVIADDGLVAETVDAEDRLGDDHAPPSSAPRSMPNWVTTGVSALRRPCR